MLFKLHETMGHLCVVALNDYHLLLCLEVAFMQNNATGREREGDKHVMVSTVGDCKTW